MARVQTLSDLTVDVEGVGQFIFARRQVRDVYRIRGEYNRLTGGNYDENGDFADISALGYATVKTLLVVAPDDFSLDNIDPLIDENFDEKVMKVFLALREKELSFRPEPGKASQEGGEGASA